MASPDRDRLMRIYAPRLAAAAPAGYQFPGGTIADPDTLGGVLDLQVVDDDTVDHDDDTVENPGENKQDPSGNGDSSVPLGEDIPPEDDPDNQNDDENDENPATKKDEPRPQFYASDRAFLLTTPGPVAANSLPTITADGATILWTPIVTTDGARTIITAPATTERAAMWGATPNPNPHMVWMQGRFVGAERPNRNGALWSTADLEVGQPTVTHGPLNWLHEERHIVGAIADARLIPASQGTEQAAATSDPHISALAAIWSWIWPQEASVVQMASDAGCLAYSMECIAQEIQCVGDTGCGESFPYMQVAAAGGGCAHLRDRSSVRRLVNPTFLGGAVIVPPTRPGWADADATVLAEAAKLAERAYEDAGRPDIPANTWEQLMAGVVDYTRNPR